MLLSVYWVFSCCGHHKPATTQPRPRWRGPASSAVYGVGKLVRNMKWERRSGGEGGAEKGSSHIRDFLAAEHFLSTFQMCKRTKFFKAESTWTHKRKWAKRKVRLWNLDPVHTLFRGVGGGHWTWSPLCRCVHCIVLIDRNIISPILWTGYFRRLTKSASAAVITRTGFYYFRYNMWVQWPLQRGRGGVTRPSARPTSWSGYFHTHTHTH